MRSTFTKIFLSFWLTEILILLCTAFILTGQFESSEIVYTSMFAMLQSNAHQSVDAYVSGGCKALSAVPNQFPLGGLSPLDQPAILLDPAGQPLCQQADPSVYAPAVETMRKTGFLMSERHGASYLQGTRIKAADGQNYYYLMRGAFPTRIYIPIPELLPRLLIGLIVSVVVTFGIALVITRPIASLRDAARQLAAGNLRARARWPAGLLRLGRGPIRSDAMVREQWTSERIARKSGDELWGLVYDFNEMADRLESLVDAQMLLLRDVSHELRSPLARLSVALELAREEAQPGMEEQLARIERETGRLNALIGQLLSLSHLESTTRLPDRLRVSLREVVAELLPDMEYEAQQRNCRVSLACGGSGEGVGTHQDQNVDPVAGFVLGSPELLGRAIENVIRNAISYTAEGTAVEIDLTQENRAGTRSAVLRVRDHGPGVPEAALKSIFRPFYRMDLSRQRSTGGYGVGLAITERAIRLHGGAVTARNAREGGLVVEMRLPLAG